MKHNAMTLERVRELLDRFYEGGTTMEEEALLSRYFEEEEVPEALAADKAVFAAMAEEQVTAAGELPSSEGLELRLQQMVMHLEAMEQKDALETVESPRLEITAPRRMPPRRWMAVAACLLLVMGVSIWFTAQREEARTEELAFADTCQTAEEAAFYAGRALSMLQSNMQLGLDKMGTAAALNKEVSRSLSKHLRFE